MVSDMDMLEEIDARLAAVADVQFAMVQRIGARIEAADEPAELVQLSEPLERCARSIRLTYALRVKLRRDVRKLDREETRIAESAEADRRRAHWDGVRNRAEALTWREADWEDEDFLDEVDRALDLERLDPAFLVLSLEQQTDRLLKRLDLKPAEILPPRGRQPEGPEGVRSDGATPFDSSG